MIIARHGERVDRENKFEWTRYVESLQLPSETAVSFRRDPPLSVNGIIMARTLANSLKRVISDIGAGRQVRIYASRMHRTVQTAREIAKEFVVKDVHISSGLVRVLPNVNNSYQFESLEELLKLSPGINLVDCDDPTSQYHLSVLSWRDALEKIASRTDSVNVVVAHCETFHGLLGKSWTQTPCCCFGVFKGARSVSSTTAAHGSGIQGTHTTRGLVGKRPDKNRHRGGGVSSDSSSSSDGDADESDGSKGGSILHFSAVDMYDMNGYRLL